MKPKIGKQGRYKGSTELYSHFIVADANSFIRCIILWSKKWVVPKYRSGQIWVTKCGKVRSSQTWNSQIQYNPIPHRSSHNAHLVRFSIHKTALRAWLTLYCLVNLANVNNGSHGAVVRYFTTTYTLRVIKPMACNLKTNTIQAINVLTNNRKQEYINVAQYFYKLDFSCSRPMRPTSQVYCLELQLLSIHS